MSDEEVLALVPGAFPLRTIGVPREVTSVAGCDCGGLQWHRAADWRGPGCSIWNEAHEARMAAVDDAERHLRIFTAGLNAQVRGDP